MCALPSISIIVHLLQLGKF